ncbi:MAG: dihydrofolate reductase [Bacteroidales bacterium]|nr:dihydrofolate reductase [Bacteroidales bacterium]
MAVKNLSLIVAIGENGEIGKNNELLWHLPNDLKRFKKLTFGHAVIMGENTYNSLPYKPLSDRKNIVLTINPMQRYAACYMAYSIEQAIDLCKNEEKAFVMGGASIYNQFLPLVSELYLTKVHAEFPEADVYFPYIDYSEWILQEEIVCYADEKHQYDYTFCTYKRKL